MEAQGLNGGGWLFLTLSWTMILTLTGYCFYKVFTTGGSLMQEDDLSQDEERRA